MGMHDRSSGNLTIKRVCCGSIFTAKYRIIRHGRWKLAYQALKGSALLRLFDVEAYSDCKPDVFSQHPDNAKTL